MVCAWDGKVMEIKKVKSFAEKKREDEKNATSVKTPLVAQ